MTVPINFNPYYHSLYNTPLRNPTTPHTPPLTPPPAGTRSTAPARAITLNILVHPRKPAMTIITLEVDGFFDYEYDALGKKLKAEKMNSALISKTLCPFFGVKKGFAIFPDAAISGFTTWKAYFKIQECVNAILNTHAKVDTQSLDYLRDRVKAIKDQSIQATPEDAKLEKLLENLEKSPQLIQGTSNLQNPLPITPLILSETPVFIASKIQKYFKSIFPGPTLTRDVTLNILAYPKRPEVTVITLDVDGFLDDEYNDLKEKLKAENMNTALVSNQPVHFSILKRGLQFFLMQPNQG